MPPVPIHFLPPWWRFFCSSSRWRKSLHQLVEAAQRLDRALVLLRQVAHELALQPFVGNRAARVEQRFDALEVAAEGEVEAVEVLLVLDQRRAGERVEVVDRQRHDALVQRLDQRQELARRDRQPERLEVQEEVDEHGRAAVSARPLQQEPEVRPHRRPLAVDDAEHHGVARIPSAPSWWLRSTPSCLAPSRAIASRLCVVEPVRAELDRDAAERLERVAEQQELALGVQRRALHALRVPGVADLEPPVRRVDVEVARAADDLARPALAHDEGHRAQPLAHVERDVHVAGHLLRRGDAGVPEPPQLAVARRGGERVDVLARRAARASRARRKASRAR